MVAASGCINSNSYRFSRMVAISFLYTWLPCFITMVAISFTTSGCHVFFVEWLRQSEENENFENLPAAELDDLLTR